MENPFKKIIEHEKLPESLKGKVMNDVELIKLSLDFTDLVAVKYPASLLDLFNINQKKKKS